MEKKNEKGIIDLQCDTPLRRKQRHQTKGMAKHLNLIKECNSVLLILDKLEEQRPLYTQEKNFRAILKRHILTLLKYQNEYWRKDIKLDGQSLRMKVHNFFMQQQLRYMKNTITSLESEDGRQITEHF